MLRHAAIAIAGVAVMAIWVRLAINPSSDLLNHREFGRRFAAGDALYTGGLDYVYPPAWAAVHALLSPIPAAIVSAAVFPIGVAAVAVLLFVLERVSRQALPLEAQAAFWVAAAALALTARFVIRDLLDAGPNLVLTALAWLSLYAFIRGRAWAGAWLLGAAIALKLTAGIFVAVLLARRQWRHALQATACAVVLFVLPVLRMGPTSYTEHVSHWWSRVTAGVTSADPSVGVLGAESDRNLSLRAAFGRALVTDSSDAPTRNRAAWIATGALVVLATVVLSALRRHGPPRAIDEAAAWAAGGVLALLVSPITWRAHAVALLPACYLLIRRWAAERRLYATAVVGLAAIAIPSIVLARGLAGESVSAWSDRWSITTVAIACLLIGTAAWPARR